MAVDIANAFWTPADAAVVKRDPNLSASSRLLYGYVVDEAQYCAGFTVVIELTKLASWLGIRPDGMSRLHAELRASGALKIQQAGSRPGVRYTLLRLMSDARHYGLLALQKGGFSFAKNRQVWDYDPGKTADLVADGFPPDPLPTWDIKSSNSTAREAGRQLELEDVLLVQELTQFGVTASIAEHLVATFGRDRCRRHLGAMPFRPPTITNPPGFLCRAIRLDYTLPPKLLAHAKRVEVERAKVAVRDREADDALAIAAERANDELLAKLPPAVRRQLEQEVDQNLEAPIFRAMLTKKPEIREHVRRNKIVTLAQEYAGRGGFGVTALDLRTSPEGTQLLLVAVLGFERGCEIDVAHAATRRASRGRVDAVFPEKGLLQYFDLDGALRLAAIANVRRRRVGRGRVGAHG